MVENSQCLREQIEYSMQSERLAKTALSQNVATRHLQNSHSLTTMSRMCQLKHTKRSIYIKKKVEYAMTSKLVVSLMYH